MVSLTSTQIRQRLSKCVDSMHKEFALRNIRTAGVAARCKNKDVAEMLRAEAQYHLQYAEAYKK
jgi:hypothetical protein